MPAGSTTAETEQDRQCIHCGLWFDSQGLHKHEANCDIQAYDRRLVDLEDPFAIARVDDVDAEQASAVDGGLDDQTATETEQGDAPTSAAPARDSSRVRVDTDDGATETPARTDGGPQAVPDGWGTPETTTNTTGTPTDDGDDATCPRCGSPDYFDPSDLPDAVLAQAPELAEYDRACGPCSKTDDGHLAPQVEVYNVDE